MYNIKMNIIILITITSFICITFVLCNYLYYRCKKNNIDENLLI